MYLDDVIRISSSEYNFSIERDLAYYMFTSIPANYRDVVMRLIALRDASLEDLKTYRFSNADEDIYFVFTVLSSVPFLRNPSQSRVDALRKSINEIGEFAEECKKNPPSDVHLCSNAISLYAILTKTLEKVLSGEVVKIPEAFILGALIRVTVLVRELNLSRYDIIALLLAFLCTYKSARMFVKKRIILNGKGHHFYIFYKFER
jgi:hypothetical protein